LWSFSPRTLYRELNGGEATVRGDAISLTYQFFNIFIKLKFMNFLKIEAKIYKIEAKILT